MTARHRVGRGWDEHSCVFSSTFFAEQEKIQKVNRNKREIRRVFFGLLAKH